MRGPCPPCGLGQLAPIFYAASETAAALANGYMADHRSPTLEYVLTSGFYSTVLSPPTSTAWFQATDIYVDDLSCLAQVSPAQQLQVTDMVLQGIKDIFPYLPYELKDSVSTKNSLQENGYWDV